MMGAVYLSCRLVAADGVATGVALWSWIGLYVAC